MDVGVLMRERGVATSGDVCERHRQHLVEAICCSNSPFVPCNDPSRWTVGESRLRCFRLCQVPIRRAACDGSTSYTSETFCAKLTKQHKLPSNQPPLKHELQLHLRNNGDPNSDRSAHKLRNDPHQSNRRDHLKTKTPVGSPHPTTAPSPTELTSPPTAP